MIDWSYEVINDTFQLQQTNRPKTQHEENQI
jgi:hypothetical protein